MENGWIFYVNKILQDEKSLECRMPPFANSWRTGAVLIRKNGTLYAFNIILIRMLVVWLKAHRNATAQHGWKAISGSTLNIRLNFIFV